MLKKINEKEKFPKDQLVKIDSLFRVFHHGERQRGDTHRFAQTEDPEDFMSYVSDSLLRIESLAIIDI